MDKEDFDIALSRLQDISNNSSSVVDDGDGSSHPLLVLACKIGAARELYEETGIDLRNNLDRLQPVQLRQGNNKKEEDNTNGLTCVLKHRLFFKICLTNDDFVTEGFDSKVALGLSQSMNTEQGPSIPLMIKLSHEHQGFLFEPNPRKAVDLLTQHSGGKVSTALSLAIAQGEIKDVIIAGSSTNNDNDDDDDDEPDKIVGHPMSNEAMDQTEGEKGVKGVFDCFDCRC